MIWSRERNRSYDNFMQCLTHWGEKASIDEDIDLVEVFNFTGLLEEDDDSKTKISDFKDEIRNIEQYALLEDMF